MAIDSRDKRASALLEGIAPVPDATLDAGDRQQVLGLYRGVLATTPAAFKVCWAARANVLIQLGVQR